MPLFRLALSLLLVLGTSLATAQAKPRIEKAADLPRFTYKIDGKVEDVARSKEKFGPFAAAVRRDNDSVLANYEIADKATQRDLLGAARAARLPRRPLRRRAGGAATRSGRCRKSPPTSCVGHAAARDGRRPAQGRRPRLARPTGARWARRSRANSTPMPYARDRERHQGSQGRRRAHRRGAAARPRSRGRCSRSSTRTAGSAPISRRASSARASRWSTCCR